MWFCLAEGQALIHPNPGKFQPEPFREFFHFDGELGDLQSRHLHNGALAVRFEDRT